MTEIAKLARTKTLHLCQGREGHDPLYDVDAGTSNVHLGDGWIYIRGTTDESGETGYAEDLLIVIQNEGWLLFWRDPSDAEVAHYGALWVGGRQFADWDDLVTCIYEL